MRDSQSLETETGPGPKQGPVDRAPRDDLERQVLAEKSKPTITPPISNLASVHITDVLALKNSRIYVANVHAKVTWDGPNDPANPKNWTYRRKWTVTIVVGAYTFISPISTSIVAPALSSIGAALQIQSEIVLALCLSIFILAYAFGPFLIGPLSEVYGRALVLQLANLFYLVFNTACGFAHNTTQIAVFRFLAGLGGR